MARHDNASPHQGRSCAREGKPSGFWRLGSVAYLLYQSKGQKELLSSCVIGYDMVWYRYGLPGEGKKALGSEEGSALWRGCRADETR